MTAPTAASFAAAAAQAAYLSTPHALARLAAKLLDPGHGMSVYDPASGSGVLLRHLHRQARRHAVNGRPAIKLFGQELRDRTRQLSRIRLGRAIGFRHLAAGDTLRNPAFLDGEGALRRFDRVVANPSWDQVVPALVWEHDIHGRTEFGVPPPENADWGWIQHVCASMATGGRAAVFLSRLTLVRDDPAEVQIRKAILDAGLLDAVFVASPHRAWPWFYPPLVRWPVHKATLLVFSSCRTDANDVLLVDAGPLVRPFTRSAHLVEELLELYRSRQSRPGVSMSLDARTLTAGAAVLDPSVYLHAARNGTGARPEASCPPRPEAVQAPGPSRNWRTRSCPAWLRRTRRVGRAETHKTRQRGSFRVTTLRRVTRSRRIAMCFNRKTLAGAGLVAVALFVLVPGSFGRVLPLLLLAACPLSMLLMMRGMSRARDIERTGEGHDHAGDDAAAEVARLRAEVDQLRAAQAAVVSEGSRPRRWDASE